MGIPSSGDLTPENLSENHIHSNYMIEAAFFTNLDMVLIAMALLSRESINKTHRSKKVFPLPDRPGQGRCLFPCQEVLIDAISTISLQDLAGLDKSFASILPLPAPSGTSAGPTDDVVAHTSKSLASLNEFGI